MIWNGKKGLSVEVTFSLRSEGQVSISQENTPGKGTGCIKVLRQERAWWLLILQAVKPLSLLGRPVISSFFINVALCLYGIIGSSLKMSYYFMPQYFLCMLFVFPEFSFPFPAVLSMVSSSIAFSFLSRLRYFFL